MTASNAREKSPAATVEPVHVFGSDLAGRNEHPGGAFAQRSHGAEAGRASGASGNAYAIPYRNTGGQFLPLEVIANYVTPFLQYAQSQPKQIFQVARFGCEPGAHDDAAMARLFALAPRNVRLPGVWQRQRDPTTPARMLLLDPSGRLKEPKWQERLRRHIDLNAPLWNVPSVELVSVGLARVIVANDLAAKKLGLKHRIIGLNEAYYGREAQLAAETVAVWYSTHFVSICDFEQTAQPQQIRITSTATRGGLDIDQFDANADD